MKRIFTYFLSTVLLAGVAIAEEYVQPGDIRIATPVYATDTSAADLSLGTYTYAIRWQGIPAASSTIAVEREGSNFVVRSDTLSSRAVRLFYELQHRAVATLGLDLSPIRSVIDVRENSKHKSTQISFLEDGEVFSIRSRSKGEPEVLRFHSGNNTFDPIAAAWNARFVEWEKGASREFDVFNGKSRYLITFTAVDTGTMNVNGVERPVWIIEPQVKNLTYPETKNKLRSAQIFLSADRYREVLAISSRVLIGSVTATLESYTPSPNLPHGTRMAYARSSGAVSDEH